MLLTKGLYKIKLQGAYRYILVWLLFVFSVPVSAQIEQRVDSVAVPFRDRVAVHTNTTDWLLLTPNIGVEYSFIQNDFNKVSFLLHGKYNPNSSIRFNPNYIYNIAGVRAEVRWYYRTRKISENERSLNSMDNWWKRALTRPYSFFAKENPRRHRAYYVGPYISFDKYTIKLGDTGYQGHAYGFGITAGYSVPLYKYRNGHAIDFEIGASVGVAMSEHDKFELDSDGMCYAFSGHKNMHVVPFPVVSDVHVAFVYRLKSIGDQMQKIDQEKLRRDSIVYTLRKKYNENNKEFIFSKISSDSISKLNSDIKKRNLEIRKINSRALSEFNVDSAMLLQELVEYYEYITIPEKFFSKADLMFPNMEIASVSELENKYIDELLERYSGIKSVDWAANGTRTTVENFDDVLLKRYMQMRQALLNNNDTISGISFIEYLVDAVPNVNSQVIKLYNGIYHDKVAAADDSDKMYLKYEIRKSDESKYNVWVTFVEGLDSVYIKKTEHGAKLYTGNTIIEAENIVKLAKLEEIFANDSAKVAVAKSPEKKKSKRKWWPFKKEKVEEVVPVDTLKGTVPLQMDSLKRHDSIMPDSIVAPIDTLRENVIGDVVLKNSLRRAFNGYPLYTKQ